MLSFPGTIEQEVTYSYQLQATQIDLGQKEGGGGGREKKAVSAK